MSISDPNKKYTYADSLDWPESEHWEIHEGVRYLQASPSWQHQEISIQIATQLNKYFLGKVCRVFTAPFDLRLPEPEQTDEEATFVVQPDIIVVCDPTKLRGTGYSGVPDLIIEITSPSTIRADKMIKFNRYEKVGVLEYWIVEQEAKIVSVFTLQDNKRYGRPDIYAEKDRIQIRAFPDLTVDLDSVFQNI